MNSLFKVSARNHAGMILMTQLASYAIEPDFGYLSLKDVADNMHLSQGFLEEIAMSLKKAGLIKGRKGPGGGYCLAKPAEQISAEQILVALEGPINLVDCHGIGCPVQKLCSSKTLWSFLQKDVLKSLRKTTLDQIIN